MKKIRIILAAAAIVLVAFITYCSNAHVRDFRHVEAQVPYVTQFYAENEAFFDLLLDIQRRWSEAKDELDDDAITGVGISIFEDELEINCLGLFSPTVFNPEEILFSNDELLFIESVLKRWNAEHPSERTSKSVSITEDEVYISVYVRNRANLGIMNPPQISEAPGRFESDGRIGPGYVYIIWLNDDWSIRIISV